MKKKTMKLLLGSSLFSLGCLMSSCGKSQSSESRDCETKGYNIEQVRGEYKNKCSDSIRAARNYDSIYAKQWELAKRSTEINRKIDSLEWTANLGGAIEKSVKISGQKVINKFFADLEVLLGKYAIPFHACGEDENNFYFNTSTQPHYSSDSKDAVWKNDLIFVGVTLYPEYESEDEDGNRYDEPQDFYSLMAIVQEVVDKSSYGQMRKDEIMQQVRNLFEKAKDQLIASRKSAEQQYADYYVTEDDKDDIAIEEHGEGDRGAGYGNFRWAKRESLQKVTHTSVYDSKLPVDFFGDQNAEYKLISLGNDKWQVQKKTASGQIEKTAVFTDKGRIESWFNFGDIDAKDESSFSYIPGENMGVHVSYSEYKIVKRAKKKWEPNKDIVSQVNSLSKQESTIDAQIDELDKRLEDIRNYADSISDKMASQRFGSR